MNFGEYFFGYFLVEKRKLLSTLARRLNLCLALWNREKGASSSRKVLVEIIFLVVKYKKYDIKITITK